MSKKILILFLILKAFDTNAQTLSFEKIYDTLGVYYFNCIRQTLDNGFIMCGSNYTSQTAQDAAIVKTDSLGNIEWVKTYGFAGTDGAITIEITSDTNYFVFGLKNFHTSYENELWEIKLDKFGDSIFSRDLSLGSGRNDVKASAKTFDNGIILAGWTNSRGNGHQDIMLMKIDSLGDSTWVKTIGGPYYEQGFSICQTVDSGFAIAGFIVDSISGIGNTYIVKTNIEGDTLWTRSFGDYFYDFGTSVIQTSDNRIIVAGGRYDSTGTSYNPTFYCLDSLGNLIWQNILVLLKENIAYGLAQNDYGEIFSAATTADSGSYDILLLKLDPNNGDTLLTKKISYNNSSSDIPYYFIKTSDGGMAIAGESDAQGYVIKLDTAGSLVNIFSHPDESNLAYLFPNPANTDCFMFSSLEFQNYLIEFYNIYGDLIASVKYGKEVSRHGIDLSNFSPGLYCYRIISDRKIISSNKIIILH